MKVGLHVSPLTLKRTMRTCLDRTNQTPTTRTKVIVSRALLKHQKSIEDDYRGDEPQPEHLSPQPQLPLPQAEPPLPQPGRLSRQRTSAPLPRPRSSSDTESFLKVSASK
ncbi:hypothetical protein J4Q44_G00016290 [Coregonus suidteri]|uniref:Uncharacterized protein n=1 Tax=Coregonus suidteri TaxID=861788 RepID=A0AAN8R2I5_9TELE